MTTTMTTTMTTIAVMTMTERAPRTKPAVAAKVMVTGASLTSVLAMTAAMGSAAKNSVDAVGDGEGVMDTAVDSAATGALPSTSDVPRDTTIMVLMADGQLVPLPPDLFPEGPPSAPVVGQVAVEQGPAATGTTVATTPVASNPVAATPVAPSPAPTTPVAPSPAPTTPVVTPAPAPSVAPTPIIVQVPTPAPAPSASTNKSR